MVRGPFTVNSKIFAKILAYKHIFHDKIHDQGMIYIYQ